MRRKEKLVTGNIYHVLNKSIAGYNIFPSDEHYENIIQIIRFFSVGEELPRFSRFISQARNQGKSFEEYLDEQTNSRRPVDIIAYCIMPTHFHLLLRQVKDNGISNFMGNVSGSYARGFNAWQKRKGFLWEGRFKNVPVTKDEQLLHLTRYIHLNPVTAGIVEKPEQWKYSSYKEYVEVKKGKYPICKYDGLFDMSPHEYRKFVEDQKDYQRELAKIKKIALE